MVGSHESNRRRHVTTRWLVALLSLVALIATACGSSTNAAGEATPATADDASAAVGDAVEDVVSAPDGAAPDAQVLAFAIQASDELSYSFEQGLSMDLNLGGLALAVDSEDAFVTGAIDGEDSRVNADIGSFLGSMLSSLGLDLGVQGPGFEGLEIDVWIVDDTMVIDMSSFAAGIGGFDPTAAAELAPFADGPVAVDLDALADLGDFEDTDASDLVQQFGQGAQITDPSAVLDALRTVEALEDAGTSTLDGVDVSVYEATVAMADYLEALDLDVGDQLGGLDDLGLPADGADGAAIEDTLEAIENLTVDLTIMLDEEGLVRRLESTIDMGAVLAAGAPALDDGADAGALGGFDLSQIEAVVHTWQNFNDYGEDLAITPPAAQDRTAEIAALLEAAN